MDKKFFFDRYGLAQADVERYLSAALSAGGDFADLYFEYQTSTSVSLDESMVKSATQGISVGCGVRVLSGERTGYAYTDDLSPERILHAARTAALIASGPAKQPVVGLTDKPAHNLYPVPLPSVEADVLAKVDLVQRADKAARAYDPRIHEVRAGYADELRHILVIGSDGSFAEDSQPLARMSVFCIAKSESAGSARGSAGGGGRVALDYFQGEARLSTLPRKPRGRRSFNWMPATLRRAKWKWCSVRDGREFCCMKPSATAWKPTSIARRLRRFRACWAGASPATNARWSTTAPWRAAAARSMWTTKAIPPTNTVLIEKGILKGYLVRQAVVAPDGHSEHRNGRRESYQHIPMPRMTNTYMLAGQDSPEDIIAR